MELDGRKRALLHATIEHYVARAEPVGSEYLAASGSFGVKPATIRSELAELTDLGYLRQPHTSAGRIPSTRGYRYYVDHLMRWAPLPRGATTRLRHISAGDVEQLLVQTCRLLSSLTGYTSVAAPPAGESAGVRSVHLVQMGGTRVLAVAVLENGRVIHRFAELLRPLSPAAVTRLSNGLDEMLRGATQPAGVAPVPAELAADDEMLRSLARLITRAVSEEARETYLEGASHILEQPEFRDADRVEPLIRFLEERRSLYEQLRVLLAGRDVAVVIGEENPHPPLHECSVVIAPYQAGDRLTGWVGVLGPTRMLYPQVAPAVDLAARSLTEAFARIGLAP
jgi:heat-inducible transcriptional repressor